REEGRPRNAGQDVVIGIGEEVAGGLTAEITEAHVFGGNFIEDGEFASRCGGGNAGAACRVAGHAAGEVSPAMVKELCGYVILGHSERRAYFGETDETVNRKLLAAQRFDLTPIVCVGETLEQYESNRTREVVSSQTLLGLKGIPPEFAPRIVVAYEPVWAIGTGKASSGANAQSVHAEVIRPALAELFGAEAAGAIRILYGGSVTASNAAEFFSQPDIDGALVGGASLKVDEFVGIVAHAKSEKGV
ncbi:MAG: triose-phosphate isomerase, partial [Chloroflexi bacterium]